MVLSSVAWMIDVNHLIKYYETPGWAFRECCRLLKYSAILFTDSITYRWGCSKRLCLAVSFKFGFKEKLISWLFVAEQLFYFSKISISLYSTYHSASEIKQNKIKLNNTIMQCNHLFLSLILCYPIKKRS